MEFSLLGHFYITDDIENNWHGCSNLPCNTCDQYSAFCQFINDTNPRLCSTFAMQSITEKNSVLTTNILVLKKIKETRSLTLNYENITKIARQHKSVFGSSIQMQLYDK